MATSDKATFYTEHPKKLPSKFISAISNCIVILVCGAPPPLSTSARARMHVGERGQGEGGTEACGVWFARFEDGRHCFYARVARVRVGPLLLLRPARLPLPLLTANVRCYALPCHVSGGLHPHRH